MNNSQAPRLEMEVTPRVRNTSTSGENFISAFFHEPAQTPYKRLASGCYYSFIQHQNERYIKLDNNLI